MSSILTSQGVVLATAMAVSGTVFLLAFCLHKSFPTSQFSVNPISPYPSPPPRSCISSEIMCADRKKRKKKMKRVHFAEDVVEPRGNGEEYRRLYGNKCDHRRSSLSNSSALEGEDGKAQGRMPANRVALYNGILRDRVRHRVAYSY